MVSMPDFEPAPALALDPSIPGIGVDERDCPGIGVADLEDDRAPLSFDSDDANEMVHGATCMQRHSLFDEPNFHDIPMKTRYQ